MLTELGKSPRKLLDGAWSEDYRAQQRIVPEQLGRKMQVVTVGRASNGRRMSANGRTAGNTCKICVRVLREGERVLRIDDFTFVHLPCLRDLVGADPEFLHPSVVQHEFELARAELMERHRGGVRVGR